MASLYKECGSLLPHSFFERSTVDVAKELLGCEIVRIFNGSLLRARIVETEAYLEKCDPAAHCSRGPTPRAKVMFGEPGTIYVYFIYGNYFMLNFVTEKLGTPGAVLIRAVEPIVGFQTMRQLRGQSNSSTKQLISLTNGPGKLARAFGIDKTLNGKKLKMPELAVFEGRKRVTSQNIVTTTRVGISVAKDLPLRFYERTNPFVSKS